MATGLALLWTAALAAPAHGARDASYSPSGTFVAQPSLAAGDLDKADFRCPKAVSLPAAPARPQALRAAKSALMRRAGSRALRAFAKSKANRSADAIPASVMTALATGRPAAALAASLRGAELEPKQPRHLINAAVLLMGFGDLRQADGLLAAAAKVKGTGAALGLTSAQALSAAKAELAVATGHFAAAERAYRKLTVQNPAVLVFNDGLSQALECQGKNGPAIARRSRAQRQMFDYVGEGDGGGDSSPPEIDAGAVDEGAGKEIVAFGGFYRPRNQDDATAHEPGLRRALAAVNGRVNAFYSQLVALPSGTRASNDYIHYATLVIERDKELVRLEKERLQIASEYTQAVRLTGEAQPQCHFSRQHDLLWSLVDRQHTNQALSARRAHRVYTALAAGVSNPAANRQLNLLADQDVASRYSNALAFAELVSKQEKFENPSPECRASTDPPADGGAGAETPEDSSPESDPCSVAKYARLKIKFGSSASAEFNCEEGKVEVLPVRWGTDQAYVGGFGEAGIRWKSGDITAVSGVKVGIGTNGLPGLPEIGVSGKGGLYVTVGPSKPGRLPQYGETRRGWAVKDWGVRLQATAEWPGPKAGSVSTISKFDNKVDFSLVGVFN